MPKKAKKGKEKTRGKVHVEYYKIVINAAHDEL